MKPYYHDNLRTLYQKDCQDMSELDDGSVDLLATDPPYGISFMGKDWDRALPDIRIWQESFRVLKPGAFAFVMSIPRADCLSRMVISLEDAGFRVDFTPIFWTYASGFPKAQNIGKAVDKRNGRVVFPEVREYLNIQRKQKGLTLAQINEKLRTALTGGGTASSLMGDKRFNELPTVEIYTKLKTILNLDNRFDELIEREEAEREVVGHSNNKIHLENLGQAGYKEEFDLTLSATPQAKALDGSYGGFQPKPAVEVIIVAMKPLSEKTFVDQALKNQKGITWLDSVRIPYESEGERQIVDTRSGSDDGLRDGIYHNGMGYRRQGEKFKSTPQGRFPANILVSDDVLNDGKPHHSGKLEKNYDSESTQYIYGKWSHRSGLSIGDSGSFSRYFDLDKWWAKTFPFLIVPKASKSEKNKGIGAAVPRTKHGSTPRKNEAAVNKSPNAHPTVKPVKLMSYLITLGSREGDIILDNFGGSGTTAVAAALLGRKCVMYETRKDYCEIAVSRCRQQVMV